MISDVICTHVGYLPSSVIKVEIVADGHLLCIARHTASNVSVSSLSEMTQATGWPKRNYGNLQTLLYCNLPLWYSSGTTTVSSLKWY